MPTVTQTYTSNYAYATSNDWNSSFWDTVTPYTTRRGNNHGHSTSLGARFYVQGPNNTEAGANQATWLPEQVTKVEIRLHAGFTQLAGAVPRSGTGTTDGDNSMLVPDNGADVVFGGWQAGRPWQIYQNYKNIAANNQSLINFFATFPAAGWWPWMEVDDGTDLRAAIAAQPEWDSVTDNAGGAWVDILWMLIMSIGGNQLVNIDSGLQMRVTAVVPPVLDSTDGVSTSDPVEQRQQIRLTGDPECFGRWYGDSPEIQTKEAFFPMSSTGSGDLPPTNIGGSGVANPNGEAWAIWGGGGLQPAKARVRLRYDSLIAGAVQRPLGHYALFCEGYDNKEAFVHWNTSYWRSKDGPISTASLRFVTRHDGLASSGFPQPTIVKAYKDGVLRWDLRFRSWTIDARSNEIIAHNYTGSGASTPYTVTRYPFPNKHRWEIQLSKDAPGPHWEARFYEIEATSPSEVLQMTMPDPSFDTLVFGVERAPFTGLCSVYIDDVELWDDYYLNGLWLDDSKKGTQHEYRHWEFFEYDGTDYNELDFVGRVQSEGPPVVLESGYDWDGLSDYEGARWQFNGPTGTNADPSIIRYNLLNYGWTGTLREIDLWRPVAPPSRPEGYPLYMWLHGGFFVSGDKSQMPASLARELVLNGWAVASIDVGLSSTDPVVNQITNTGSLFYPAWNPAYNTARHPTQILDYKLAAEYLQRSSIKSTYDLSGLIVAGGHSAGGYPALMAMVTKDIANDGNGLSYRIQDHNGTFGYPVVDDPDIAGVFVTSPPTDLEEMIDFDFTRRTGLVYAGTGNQYTMNTTVQLYWGLNFGYQPTQAQMDGSKVANMIALQSTDNLGPIVYNAGKSDHLVPGWDHYRQYGWDQSQNLEDAYAAKGIADRFEKVEHGEVQHYQTPYRRRIEHMIAWLDDIRHNQ